MKTRLVLLAAIAVLAMACSSTTTSPSAEATEPPATAEPSAAAPSGDPTLLVDLIENVGADASIAIYDESGTLTAAESGTPGDGGSVPNGAVQAAALAADPNTVVLTWTGSPCDTTHTLTIAADGKAMHIDRPRCEGDSIPVDHVLQLTFDQPVDVTTLSPTITRFD